MNVKIDKNLCIGCGLCEENVPELFSTGEFTAELKKTPLTKELLERAAEAAEDCPAEAITIDEMSAES